MKVGYFAYITNPTATRDFVEAVGTSVDAGGFHSIWLGEHTVLFDDYRSRYPYSDDGSMAVPRTGGLLEPLTSLAFLAACTQRVRLATGLYILPQHNPVAAAKAFANIDWLSNGRLDVGIGVGWAEDQFEALAVPWPKRGTRTNEYLEVLNCLWQDDPSSFDGEFYKLPPCRFHPKPIQKPGPPIYIGGNSLAALRRVARHGNGWLGISLDPDAFGKGVRRIETFAREAGRDPATLEYVIYPAAGSTDLDLLKRYHDAGATQILVSAFGESAAEMGTEISRLADTFVSTAAEL